ncbi:MAG TPA: hypothetical protein VKT77_17335 [Chthonomonadaceae bacterium]|nr:hypothetical protein [Chthonomonadaceae bacterium]
MAPWLLGALLMLPALFPTGSAPAPVPTPHFPDRLHAFVWRNWTLVPIERLAKTVGARPDQVVQIGRAMGLPAPRTIGADQQARSAITVIRRNWHLLPYEQLLTLLDWTPQRLEYSLREDDFLFIKLGSIKPRCAPLRYRPPDVEALRREREIAATLRREFPEGLPKQTSPLFSFVHDLSRPAAASAGRVGSSLPPAQNAHTSRQATAASPGARPTPPRARLLGQAALRPAEAASADSADSPQGGAPSPGAAARPPHGFAPCFCCSYFALYGDPLLDPAIDPYPDAYLDRLAADGIDGVWLPVVLYKLAPFPWQPALSDRYQERLAGLRRLTERARRHGIGVYLYLNEPRAMPIALFRDHPELKGVVEGDHAALCTSRPEVQRYITDSVAAICKAAPQVAGFFTITASENLTSCWSHGKGADCPRCGPRGAAAVIAEVNDLVDAGIKRAGSGVRLIAWDWGWPEASARAIIDGLPADTSLMSVSEWDLPISRGGVDTTVGEYSLSAVGPGPRACRHWAWARARGLRVLAKIQAANSWELSAVPFIPALQNVAEHAAQLRAEGIDGVMAGWTLGGYPSPNLEVLQKAAAGADPDAAMLAVAQRRYGAAAAPRAVQAWRDFSAAFREFPFHIGLVYTAPLQFGPSNLLWAAPTGYRATMIGFPYDDLDSWRAVYPPDVFVGQLRKVADGFDRANAELGAARQLPDLTEAQDAALRSDADLAEAAGLHFRSAANQARFIVLRREVAAAGAGAKINAALDEIEAILNQEIAMARLLCVLQSRDSRIGFEASNQYYYVPIDLMEKVLNCVDLRDRWLPAVRSKLNHAQR